MPEQPNGSLQTPPDLGKITADLREAGGKMGDAAVGKAEDMAQRTLKSGVDQVHAMTQVAERAADQLQQQSPMIADYVRDAAKSIDRMGSALRERTVGDLLTSATDFGRKQPVLFFAGAAVIGFALSRFVRTGISASTTTTSSPESEERDAVVKSTGINV